jgi:hypothetical protein
VSVERNGETFHYDIRLSRERSPAAGFPGSVIVLHDITERVRLFEEVKTLRGIVPICGKCKRVRTDEGYWQQWSLTSRSFLREFPTAFVGLPEVYYPLESSLTPEPPKESLSPRPHFHSIPHHERSTLPFISTGDEGSFARLTWKKRSLP